MVLLVANVVPVSHAQAGAFCKAKLEKEGLTGEDSSRADPLQTTSVASLLTGLLSSGLAAEPWEFSSSMLNRSLEFVACGARAETDVWNEVGPVEGSEAGFTNNKSLIVTVSLPSWLHPSALKNAYELLGAEVTLALFHPTGFVTYDSRPPHVKFVGWDHGPRESWLALVPVAFSPQGTNELRRGVLFRAYCLFVALAFGVLGALPPEGPGYSNRGL